MHNAAPARGTEAWYAWMEQRLQEIDTDRKRLWDRLPQAPDIVGESPQDPDYVVPSSS